jgi:hypothetical protein
MNNENIVRHEQILRDLVQKRDKASAQVELIGQERKRIGFNVFVDNDKSARKKLDELNLSSATIAGDLEAMEAAICEAKSRLAAAKAADDRAADEVKAKALLEVAAAFDDHVTKLSEAADALVLACSTIAMLQSKAYSLGAGRPTEQQLKIMVGRIVCTTIMRAGLQRQVGTEFLAPGDRKTADGLRQYADAIRTDAGARLGDERRAA